MNLNPTKTHQHPDEVVDAMRDIIADVNRFLVDWSARYARCADQAKVAGQADQVLRKQIAEFLTDQKDWESQKLIEQQQLEAIANQLTEAWIRLESEQRAVQHNGAPAPVFRPVEPQSETVENPGEPVTASEPASVERLPVSLATSSRVTLPPDIIPRDAAIRQFEKLKNAIRSTRHSSV